MPEQALSNGKARAKQKQIPYLQCWRFACANSPVLQGNDTFDGWTTLTDTCEGTRPERQRVEEHTTEVNGSTFRRCRCARCRGRERAPGRCRIFLFGPLVPVFLEPRCGHRLRHLPDRDR